MEDFRTGNPSINFSGYPGSEFPQECGSGHGGGHGSYGTYPSCGAQEHENANIAIDYNEPKRPVVSQCGAPLPQKNSTRCGIEGFTGGCQMPPHHHGAGSCGYCDFNGEYQDHGHSDDDGPVENFEGNLSPYGSDAHSYNDIPVAGACSSTFNAQHNPGCECIKCMMPYSAPYAAGPNCRSPSCNCKRCDGDCCGSNTVNKINKFNLIKARIAQAKQTISSRNIIIALVIAYIAYRLFRK